MNYKLEKFWNAYDLWKEKGNTGTWTINLKSFEMEKEKTELTEEEYEL